MNLNVKCAVFLCWLVSLPSFAEDQISRVEELLQLASKSLQEKNYKGRFTYEFGSTLETLELVHAVKDGVEFERVSHLSGTEREFLRAGRELDCVSPGSYLLRGGLISSQAGIIGLSQNYRFFLQGSERIAGREASVIKVIPKDEYRYGMTVALDKESYIPLMSLTTASPKVALERFQFVQVQIGGEISSEDLQPIETIHKTLDGANAPCSKKSIGKPKWQASWLPPGFVLSQASRKENETSILTYTDGIASFTLFISTVDAKASLKHGAAVRGATIALMTSLPYESQQLSVILIGEIPLIAADRVAASVVPQLK